LASVVPRKEQSGAEQHRQAHEESDREEGDRELRRRLKQTQPFESRAQEAMLSLMVAGAAVEQEVEQACARFGLTASHYNVLRILAGGPDSGYARGDIIERMIDRGPDVTRLMDRLEEQGLADRRCSAKDRRVTLHRITEEGETLLEEMHADIRAVQRRFAERLSEDDQQALSTLCAKVYGVTS
jgi:DNA-binding MarR family transcriptional regulator